MLASALDSIIQIALAEDLAAGDVTTDACISDDVMAAARAVARHEMIVCGSAVFKRVFEAIDSTLTFSSALEDGVRAIPSATMWTVSGKAASILKGERTALNFVQRMCGIATITRAHVDALPAQSKTRIVDTRKTTPGLRVLERYAVRVGGGHNHRDNLGSAVLIKDNHIVAAGGIREAITRAKAYAPHTSKIECEIDSLDQLEIAIEAGADIILLDNMNTETIREAVGRTRGRALLEASGGITRARISELAKAGVDVISIGALTHSAPAADIGLDFEPKIGLSHE